VPVAKQVGRKIFEYRMNRDAPVVVERPREMDMRQVLSLPLGAVAVGSLIFQHGFELRRFSVLFTWL
jgi:hypothetical protein